MTQESNPEPSKIEDLDTPPHALPPEEAEQAEGGTTQFTRSVYYEDAANLAQLDPNARQGIWEN